MPVTLESPVQKVGNVRDISSQGICFSTDSEVEKGSEVHFTLALPPEITLSDPMLVECRGRVVRVDREPCGTLAIAAQIEHYQFVSK